jgi:hypothetical protein
VTSATRRVHQRPDQFMGLEMISRFLLAASLLAMLLSSPAMADDAPAKDKDPAADLPPAPPGVMDLSRPYPGYTYFNKPGADLDAQNSDLKYCGAIAVLGIQPRELMPSAGGILGAIISSAITSMEVKRGHHANIENCMIVRGWRVVQVPDDEGEKLSKLDQASLSEQLKAWVGSEPPHGQVVRAWDNDLTKGQTLKFREAGPVVHRSFGEVALAQDFDAPASRPAPGPQPPKSARQPHSINADHIAGVTLGPDEALLIIRVRHPGMSKGLGVELERLGPDPITPAWYIDQKPFDLAMAKGLLFAKGDGEDYAYVVPAGTWRLTSFLSSYYAINLCFGAPAFIANPGDVIYAGAFDLAADDIGPDMTLDPAKVFLARAPALQAKLQPATWTNGFTALCSGTYFYAYEMKGVPMLDGYIRGTAPLAPDKPSKSGAGAPSAAPTPAGS